MGCCGGKADVWNPPMSSPATLVTYEGKGPWAHTNYDTVQRQKFAAQGAASKEGCPPSTIPLLFQKCVKECKDKVALRQEQLAGSRAPAQPVSHASWKCWTWQQYYDESRAIAKALIALGCKPHESVNIFGFNSPQWFMSEMGAIMAGMFAAGIYPSDTSEQVQYKCQHSNGTVATCQKESNVKKFESQIDELPQLKALVVWADDEFVARKKELTRSDGTKIALYTWSDFKASGSKVDDSELQARIDAQSPGECAALIYTSGTTGNPKAVMITHDNVIFEASTVLSGVNKIGVVAEEERIISYLPLSHVAGMMVDIVLPVVVGAQLPGWCSANFARADDLKTGLLGDRLRAVKPTAFLGVPRVWEKIADKVKEKGKATKGMKLKIAKWAKAKGLQHQMNSFVGGSGAKGCCYCLADKLVFKKVKAALGLDECKFAMTGAAPMRRATAEYFGALGLNINDLYGMSECTGATTISTDETHVWGSCGFALPGTEVKVFQVDYDENGDRVNTNKSCPRAKDMFKPTDAEQGEICYRGRHIMLGYLANPVLGEDHVKTIQKKTMSAVDAEGWLHSGDKGCMSREGMVKITGRYKELIIGAGGENIAPVPIENNLKKLLPFVNNVMMIGNKRKFNSCFFTLKAKGATGEEPGTNELDGPALDVDAKITTISAAMEDGSSFVKAIEEAIFATNKNQNVCPNNASKIRKFSILPHDFSVATGECTPTLKLKRGVVDKMYKDTIDQFYADENKKANYILCTHAGADEEKV